MFAIADTRDLSTSTFCRLHLVSAFLPLLSE